jgi:hypothetical protein
LYHQHLATPLYLKIWSGEYQYFHSSDWRQKYWFLCALKEIWHCLTSENITYQISDLFAYNIALFVYGQYVEPDLTRQYISGMVIGYGYGKMFSCVASPKPL